MAYARRRTSRTAAIRREKLRAGASLHHNRKLLTGHNRTTNRDAALERGRNIHRRKTGRRKTLFGGKSIWDWRLDLDPTTWWRKKTSR